MLHYKQVPFVHDLLSVCFPPRREPVSELIVGRRGTIRGHVVARDLLSASLSEKPCVYYQYTVEQWQQTMVVGMGSDGLWLLHDRDEAIVEFYLMDQHGDQILINPDPARIIPKRGNPGEKVDIQFLNHRAHEYRIAHGDYIEVEGFVSRAHDPFLENQDYRSPHDTLALVAPENERLIIRCL